MRMMPRAVPMRMCVLRMRVGPWSMQTPEISQSSKRTSNMKSDHNLYVACEDSPQRTFFFCCPLSFYCNWQTMLHIYLYTCLEALLTVSAVQVLG